MINPNFSIDEKFELKSDNNSNEENTTPVKTNQNQENNLHILMQLKKGDLNSIRKFLMTDYFKDIDSKFKLAYNLISPAVYITNFKSTRCKTGILDKTDLKKVN